MSYQDPITVSGPLVTFNDPDGDGRITNLSAAISPVQDLNGYDHPWPAGGGKNKLPVTLTTRTVNGVTFTVNDDGTISLSGTATANIHQAINTMTKLVSGESYKLAGCPTGGGTAYYMRSTRGCVFGATGPYFGTAASATDEALYLFIFIASGTNTNGLVFKPMICLASETDATFAPYSNICPISGWDSVEVQRTGKNLLENELTTSTVNGTSFTVNADGSITVSGTPTALTRVAIKRGLAWDGREAAFFSFGTMPTGTRVFARRIYNGTQNYPTISPSGTTTIGAEIYDIYLEINTSFDGTAFTVYPQLELGSTATAYTPYQGDNYQIQLGQTVYGGTLDVVTGVLTVNKMMFSANTSTMDNVEDFPGWKSSGVKANNPVSGAQANALTNVGKGCSINTSGSNDIIFLPKTYYNGMTQSEWIALAQDVQIVYELATPLTYQLTQQEVEALLGTNNIWADAGDVTVTYQLARHGFEGWLIKVGTEQTEIPLNFIRYSTYKVTPDQRMEWSAERNVNGVLQRKTVPNMPPKIEFNTKLLTNSDVTALMSILNKSFTVASERKLPVYFYDPENNTYKTCDCYMPDIDFKIRNVDAVKNIINYEELRFAFIGY